MMLGLCVSVAIVITWFWYLEWMNEWMNEWNNEWMLLVVGQSLDMDPSSCIKNLILNN
jgi:hypothetical protein